MPPLAIAAGVSAIGSVAGGAMQASAARDAAAAQASAAERATALQEKMYNQTRDDNAAYRSAGYSALTQMQNPEFQRSFSSGDMLNDPGYQFRLAEGQKALERSAAARGGLGGGAFGKALLRYGQDYASNEYGNTFNRFQTDQGNRFGRLFQIAGMGQGANASNASAAQNFGNQASQNIMGAANAQGAAGMAGANAWSGALSGLAKTGMDTYNMSQQQSWMDKQQSNLNQPAWNPQPLGSLSQYGRGVA